MTLMKAHKLVNILIKSKQEKKDGLQDSKQPWNTGDDFLKNVALIVVEGLDNDIE